MADLNYFNGVVRILEIPEEKILNDKFSIIRCRVQLSQTRGKRAVMLNAWTKFTKDTLKNYTTNDYLLVEGYLSLKTSSKKRLSYKIFKKVHVNAIRIYPYVLNSNK